MPAEPKNEENKEYTEKKEHRDLRKTTFIRKCRRPLEDPEKKLSQRR